jgi:D-glycero-D-manno-heptose 1,7-bisphosphate phosphatase
VRAAVFLDRDGTVIEESGYLDRLDRLVVYPFAVDAVRLLNRAGLAVVVVSNQSGIARGLLREAFVQEAHAHLQAVLAAGGARLDGFYYCPHHPEATVGAYRAQCECRKPGAGMLRQAAADLHLDLGRSVLVGDRWGDVQAAHAAGGRGVLVRTGYGAAAEAAPRPGVVADAVVDDLAAAVSWILLNR